MLFSAFISENCMNHSSGDQAHTSTVTEFFEECRHRKIVKVLFLFWVSMGHVILTTLGVESCTYFHLMLP